MIYIAHRGESYEALENSLSAFNLAWNQNADAIEIDVQLTLDNEIVVLHDRNTKRIFGVSKEISSEPLAELKRLNSRFHKGKGWLNEKIPTLQEVLKSVPTGKQIFIEIKCGVEIIPKLKNVIESFPALKSQIKLIGFDVELMSQIKKSFPQYEVFGNKSIGALKMISTRNGWQKLISSAKKNNLDGLNLSYSNCLNQNAVDKIKSNNLKLFVWTVDNPNIAYRLFKLGVDGIMTNRTGWLRDKINELKKINV